MKFKILVIEDEQDIRELLHMSLESEQYEISTAARVDEALLLIQNNSFNLFLIDWMLPGSLSGIDACHLIRQNKDHQDTPIIMLTAKTQPENIVEGLDAGADDYITKPFNISVLKARIRAQLRNINIRKEGDSEHTLLEFGPLRLDLAKCKVWVEDEEIYLTSTELKILIYLSSKPGHVFTREQLIQKIQGPNVHVTGRTIDTHIVGLRKKLSKGAELVETIRGIGYRFSDELFQS